jgi:amidase
VSLGPVRELTAAIRSGEIAPDDPVKLAVLEVERKNEVLNAIVFKRSADALREAAELSPTESQGEMLGIPFTAKDMLATKDLPTTCGSQSLAGWMAGVDSTAVAKMRAAGAVLVGKTNCPEFALGVDTDNDLFGRTRNPLGDWTPGGSSGGESAAVAAGMSIVGLGSDYGGSVRWPAQCAGLVGLRPTVRRVSRAGEQPTVPDVDPLTVDCTSFQDTVQVVGPLARTVDDVALALNVISGADGIDPLAVDRPLPDYRELKVSDIEVRWGVETGDVAVAPEIAAGVRSAAQRLDEHGARVRQGLPDEVSAGLEVYDRLRSAEYMSAISALHMRTPELIGTAVKRILASRITISDDERRSLWAERSRLIAALRRWLMGERVLLLPVSIDVPRDLGGDISNFELLTPSRAISLFGVPALSVPVALSRSGAPVSVQIVAPAFREDVALAVGAALEHSRILNGRSGAPCRVSNAR